VGWGGDLGWGRFGLREIWVEGDFSSLDDRVYLSYY